MPERLQHALMPAMTGYNFQQTALIGMLPVLAAKLALAPAEVGLAIAAGLVVSAVTTPLMAGSMTMRRLRGALIAMLLSSLALAALLLSPRPVGIAFAILLAIRCVQGTAAAIILSLAQGASARAERPVAALARVQIGPGLGRALGAALIGPMLQLSIVLPVLPALIGAAAGLRRLRDAGPDAPGLEMLGPGRAGIRAPWLAALAVPFLVQSAVGAGQLGLGPLLAQTRPPEQAATIAGLCLAAGYLALLLVHYRWTGRGTAARPAAALLIVALILPALSAAPVVLVAATALAAALVLAFVLSLSTTGWLAERHFVWLFWVNVGVAGLLIARHLARVIKALPGSARQNAAWQGSAMLAGLGTGAGGGSLVLPLGPVAPFLLGGGFALVSFLICQRFP
ncbi:MAG TPA: hypothetical protein PLI13_13030 [Paracoccus sp. (in: a-proteobacteria)]|nr:hypothetical protein [Paracoccus sp. (in: a-proteobacteria)]